MTPTLLHETIRAALVAAGVHAIYGPADSLPLLADGRVGHAAVLWPSPGSTAYTRTSGGRSGRADAVTITCVGATSLDAIKVAYDVDAALGGLRLSAKGGTLSQSYASRPEIEPDEDPVRVSLALEYTTVTKG